MKKIKLILFTFLILLVNITNASAYVEEMDRTSDNNYGVNKKWKITESNLYNIKNTPYVNADDKIYDFSDVLSDEDKETIYDEITDFREKTGMEMIILIANHPYYSDYQNEEFASDFYDYNDFGIDLEHYDGILLFRNTYESDPYYDMYTFGKAQLYFNSGRYNRVLDDIYSDLHNKNYLEGFKLFKKECLNYVNEGIASNYKNAYIDDMGYIKYNYRAPIFLAIILSSIITLIVVLVLVSKNKMVKLAEKATEYLNKESLVFTKREDIFLRSMTTSYTVSSSSGGGGSHGGSSGGGHSSGGGRHG